MTTASEISKTLETHRSTVSPGQPAHLTEAHQIGDGVWQGDLGIEIVARGVPDGYVEVAEHTDASRQLVPEGGEGSHHRIRDWSGVRMWVPRDWGESVTSLSGPYIEFDEPNAIQHERATRPHGTVFIDSPMSVRCRYQRNLDAEEREARARD